ncbi:hypothetical protein [Thiolapillus brandeum]|uniref:hypothetical protein n=1 Tax=Thiolapillus brandeum TaxID=1076588 RepID=UPI000596EE93|nr:hypothetical protein [Thiolapillus brandeum]
METCYCDYEPASVYEATEVQARKPHQCEECNRTIHPGEKYERVKGIWDGTPGTYNTCRECLALRQFIKAHIPCFCWAHGRMIDDAREVVEEYGWKTTGLRFGAARRLIEIRKARRQSP